MTVSAPGRNAPLTTPTAAGLFISHQPEMQQPSVFDCQGVEAGCAAGSARQGTSQDVSASSSGKEGSHGGLAFWVPSTSPSVSPWEEQLSDLLAKLKDNAALPEKRQAAADFDAAVAMMKDAGGFAISKIWVRIGRVQELRQDHINNQNKDKTWKTKPRLSMPNSLQATSCRTCF